MGQAMGIWMPELGLHLTSPWCEVHMKSLLKEQGAGPEKKDGDWFPR